MMKKLLVAAAATAVLFAPSLAYAHPGPDGSVLAGFVHPFTGVDHLLALISLGVFAAQLANRRAIGLVGGFFAVFALSLVSARSGFSLPAQEAVLAASLLVMGALVILGRRLPFALSLSVTALFAAYHGVAHGAELGAFTATGSLAGFCLAGLVLTTGGYAVGRQLSNLPKLAVTRCQTAVGLFTSCVGLLLLTSI